MKDFVAARQETVDAKVRINVPVLLPGHGVIGTFGSDPNQQFSGLLVTAYAIPMQPLRMLRRTINKVVKPNQPVYEQAKLRNFEIVVTSDEIHYCPTSPVLLKTYAPVETIPLDRTPIHFETVQSAMSKLTVGDEVWNVHPEYEGDVRWELRRLKDDEPRYDITFSGGELAELSADDEVEALPESGAAVEQNEEE